MSFLAGRVSCSNGLMGSLLRTGTVSIRNFNLHPRIAPILSSSNRISTEKRMDVVPVRKSSTGNHVPLWTAEKVFSAALLPIIPAAFIFTSPTLDYLLAFTLTLHTHWGVEAIVVDYVRPSVFGPVIPKLALALVYGLSALTLGSLWYFTYTDVGLAKAVKMLWKL